MHLAELFAERRGGYAVAQLPAGDMEGFAKGRHHKAARRQRRVAVRAVALALEHNVFIDLVADHQQLVFFGNAFQFAPVFIGKGGGGRVVGAVDHDQPGSGFDTVFNLLPVGLVMRGHQCKPGAVSAGKSNGRFVAVIGRVQQNHIVAGPDHSLHRDKQGLGGAGGESDFQVGVDLAAVAFPYKIGDGFAQLRNAVHGRVLITATGRVVIESFQQILAGGKIGEAL